MTTILAAIVGGLLTMVGGVFQRAIREWGDVRITVEDWQLIFPMAITADDTATTHVNVAVPNHTPYIRTPPDTDIYASVTASYALIASLFNEKEIGTSLRDLALVFQDGKGKETVAPLWHAGEEQPAGAGGGQAGLDRRHPSTVSSLAPWRAEEFLTDRPTASQDLWPRSSVLVRLSGQVEGQAGREAMLSKRVFLRGAFPNGSQFCKEIAVLEEISEYGDEWRTAREQPRSWWRRMFGGS